MAQVQDSGTSLGLLVYPMVAHVALVTLLYFALTVVRAPAVWGVGANSDGSNPWAEFEPRISANLSNQFEWPLFFYAVCVLASLQGTSESPILLWLSWVFIAGRLIHSAVQIFTANIRLRGIVFTLNFLAVLGMWFYTVFQHNA